MRWRPTITAITGDTANGDAATRDAAAERAALSELGDPEILAARYTDRSLYLIGPGYYLDYRRLLGLLIAIVVPIVTLATVFAGLMAGTTVAAVALTGVTAGIGVGVQLAFWVTLVFALVERNGTRKTAPADGVVTGPPAVRALCPAGSAPARRRCPCSPPCS